MPKFAANLWMATPDQGLTAAAWAPCRLQTTVRGVPVTGCLHLKSAVTQAAENTLLINPAWVGAKAGTGMAGFITGALAKVGGAHPAVAGWYGSFLSNVVQPNIVVWSYLITFGE